MIKFLNEEKAYQDWCDTNPNGFVFNHFGGNDPNMNVLHKVSCTALWSAKGELRTSVEKWCSSSKDELIAAANRERGNGEWIECSRCNN